MLRNKAWALAGVLLISACNSSEGTGDNAAAADVQENVADNEPKAVPSEVYSGFNDAIKFAFASDFQEQVSSAMARQAPQVASGLGTRAFEFTCEIMYENYLNGITDPSQASLNDACGIIARISKNLPESEKENLFRAEIADNIVIRKIWEGQAKFQNRTLPVIMVEAHLGVVNRSAGFKKELCVRELYVDDKEFSVKRGSRYLSCNPEDPEQIKEAMAANEVLTPYQVGAAAGPMPSINDADNRQAGRDSTQGRSAHEQAIADNKLSTQGIMAAWNAIDTSTRADILPQQRAWIKSKDANCSVEAASASLDQTEQETARLKCDTKANRSRIDWLKKYLPQ